MDFKKLIQVADVFGTETRNLAKLKEDELADRLRQALGWDAEDAEAVEQSVIDTGNDPAEVASVIAPTVQTDSPAQPVAPTDNAPGIGADSIPATGNRNDDPAVNRTPPAAPETPAQETPPATSGTETPPATSGTETPPATGDSAADVAQDDAARTQPQGDALAGRLDTSTPSLLDAYNSGGRRAMDSVRDLQTALSRLGFDPNGIDGKYGRGTYAAVQEFQRQNGLTVDGEAGPTTMAKLKELIGASAGAAQQGDSAADVAQDDAARVQSGAGAAQQGDSAADVAQDDAARVQSGAGDEAAAQAAIADRERAGTDASGETPTAGGPSIGPADDGSDTAGEPEQPRVSDELGMQSNGTIVNFNVDQFKQSGTYIDVPDRNRPGFVTRVYGPRNNLQQFIQNDRRGRGLTIQGNDATSQQAGTPDAERDGRERGVQTASKEFNMKKYIKESKALDECGPEMSMPRQEGNPVTMSVTLNASGEQHVQDLIRMMQLAGAKDAAPVAAMHVGPVDKHDDMVNMMRMVADEQDESVEEEWDNSPQEDYRDHKHMTKDLSGGLNREKKAYAKAQDGDNAMAVESIKDVLIQALEEKYANDAQRKAVHAAKNKKK